MQGESEAFRKAVRSMGGLSGVTDDAYTNQYARKNFMNTYTSFKETMTAREIKNIAGVEDKKQLKEAQVRTDDIVKGIGLIGNK